MNTTWAIAVGCLCNGIKLKEKIDDVRTLKRRFFPRREFYHSVSVYVLIQSDSILCNAPYGEWRGNLTVRFDDKLHNSELYTLVNYKHAWVHATYQHKVTTAPPVKYWIKHTKLVGLPRSATDKNVGRHRQPKSARPQRRVYNMYK